MESTFRSTDLERALCTVHSAGLTLPGEGNGLGGPKKPEIRYQSA